MLWRRICLDLEVIKGLQNSFVKITKGRYMSEISIIEKAIIDFENVLMYLDALNDYFNETSKMLNNKKLTFPEKHKVSYRLMEILDEIYDIEREKRNEYIDSIQDKIVIGNIALKDIINISISDDDVIQYSMKKGYEKENYTPKYSREKLRSIRNQEMIFIRAILTNAIIIFEQFFAAQYETLVIIQPKAYFEDKKIPISEFFEYDINQILQKTVAKEVESNMFDSLKTLDKIKEKSKINIDRFIPIRKQFEEIYYRRNAYVHSQGKANEIYLEKVDKKFIKGVKIDSPLICDDCYLENVITTVYKIISSLHFELLNVLEAKQEDYDYLANLGFEFLKNANYELAEYIYGILRREKSFEFRYKAMYEINYINALKLQGKDIDELIKGFDVSIATDEFKIAKYCLLDNHKNTYDLLLATYPQSFNAEAIREWPIFKIFRETDYYKDFIKIHKDDFDTFLFEDDNPKENTQENLPEDDLC